MMCLTAIEKYIYRRIISARRVSATNHEIICRRHRRLGIRTASADPPLLLAREPPIVHERSKTAVSVATTECRPRAHNHPPTAKSRTAAVATQFSTSRFWIADCPRNSLNSWKHGLHEQSQAGTGLAPLQISRAAKHLVLDLPVGSKEGP
jgi:hypothetical protein